MKKLSTLLAGIIITTGLFAQTVYPYHEDGTIFFKIKKEVRDNIRYFEDAGIEDIDFLYEIAGKYKFRELSRPFFFSTTEGIQRIFQLKFADYYNVDKIVRDIQASGKVEYVEKANLYKILDEEDTEVTPNDPSIGQQWHLNKIKAPLAWDIATGSKNVLVVVIDNFIQTGHPDLVANRWANPGEIPNNNQDDDQNGLVDDVYGYDFLDKDGNTDPPAGSSPSGQNAHGTHNTGIIAAMTNNGQGIAGVGHNVSFGAIKTNGNDGSSSLGAIYAGIQWAALMGADVVNMSVGGAPGTPASDMERDIINDAYAKGVVLVAAAGNNDISSPIYPAAYDHVIAVANTEQTDKKRASSNHGSWIDVAAPGVSIYSLHLNGTYGSRTGTSQAAPVVAGICALMRSLNPNITVDQLENCLESSAVDISALNPSYNLGAGRVDAQAALQCVASTLSPNDASITGIKSSKLQCQVNFKPEVELSNFGTSTLSKVDIKYQIAGGAVVTKNWTGSLASTKNTTVILDPTNLSSNGAMQIDVWTEKPNGQTDGNASNDKKSGTFYSLAVPKSLPFSEGFNNATFPPNEWSVVNPDADKTWERTTIAQSGGGAARIFNYEYTVNGQTDDLMLPSLNLTGVKTMTFYVAYNTYSPLSEGHSEELQVLISTDCGVNWNTVYSKKGSDLVTASPNTDKSFEPNSSQWRKETVDLSAYSSASNALIIFRQISDYENNLYIDEINIDKTTDVDEITLEEDIRVYPNPANDAINIDMSFAGNENTTVILYDAIGNLVYQNQFDSMSGTVIINTREFESGIYFLEVTSGKEKAVKKLSLIK